MEESGFVINHASVEEIGFVSKADLLALAILTVRPGNSLLWGDVLYGLGHLAANLASN